jgi:hypothetical protein
MTRSTLITLLLIAAILTGYAWLWAAGIVDLPEFNLCECLSGTTN